MALSLGLKLWLVISIPVVLWDAFYVLLRPRTMAGGDLFWLWKPYAIYIRNDGRYASMEDDWVKTQSWGNLVEVVGLFVSLLLSVPLPFGAFLWLMMLTGANCLAKGKLRSLSLFAVSVATFWKTVLYFLMELVSDYRFTKNAESFLLLFVLPSAAWLLGPLYTMYVTGQDLLSHSTSLSAKSPKKRN